MNILVFERKCPRLKSPPSIHYSNINSRRMAVLNENQDDTHTQKKMKTRIGAMMHLCITSVWVHLQSITKNSRSYLVVEKPQDFDVFFRASKSSQYFLQCGMTDVSKALARSTKTIYRSWCCSRHFSRTRYIAKTMQLAPQDDVNHNEISEGLAQQEVEDGSWRWGFSLEAIPRQFPHTNISPLLKIVMLLAFLRSSGISLSCSKFAK